MSIKANTERGLFWGMQSSCSSRSAGGRRRIRLGRGDPRLADYPWRGIMLDPAGGSIRWRPWSGICGPWRGTR